MKNPFILLLAFAATCCVQAFAATSPDADPQRLVVWLKDGSKVYHDLTDEPVTTFADGSLFLTTAKVSISYPLEQVVRYTYEGNIPVIGIAPVKDGEMRFLQGSDEMRFDGLPSGTRIELYAPDGKLLSTQVASQGQPAVVSLKGMPQGTYIVKAGDATYKFLKR